MEVYLISNNLYENRIGYQTKDNIDKKRMTRPLSVEGEKEAKNIAILDDLADVNVIYSSIYASSIASAKYLADRLDKKIIVDEYLHDFEIGDLKNYSLKMVKFMQNHDFDIRLNNGESLNDISKRITNVINKIVHLNLAHKVAVFTHQRLILGFLIGHGKCGYNLEDELIIEYNDEVIYSGEEKEVDIIKITYEDDEITKIEVIDF